MLLSSERLFSLATEQRLPAVLAASRKHQNLVSTKLSRQVMEALFDLLRGFQAAHDQNAILESVLRTDPNQVYAGLLTVLLRLVFVLYAEDRGLLSSDPIFVNNYSVAGLFERLREDQAHNPDTMDSRYGAWARLLALFRLIWRGAKHGGMKIPGRRGYLFDPDRYPFLEGREGVDDSAARIPRVPDGVIYRVLLRLLVLDGERLSYRNLDPMLAAIKIQLGIISADLDKIAASDLTVVAAVAAIKQQQSVMNGNIVTLGGALATLQTTLEEFMGTQALTAAQLEASQAATAADLVVIKTSVTGLTAQITAQTAQINLLTAQLAANSPVTAADWQTVTDNQTGIQATADGLAAAMAPAPPAAQTAQARKA
jgi:hypothetical protein